MRQQNAGSTRTYRIDDTTHEELRDHANASDIATAILATIAKELQQ